MFVRVKDRESIHLKPLIQTRSSFATSIFFSASSSTAVLEAGMDQLLLKDSSWNDVNFNQFAKKSPLSDTKVCLGENLSILQDLCSIPKLYSWNKANQVQGVPPGNWKVGVQWRNLCLHSPRSATNGSISGTNPLRRSLTSTSASRKIKSHSMWFQG